MALNIWASSTIVPGSPNGQILNLTDDDKLNDGGVALTDLPAADGLYTTNNAGFSEYTGTPTQAHFENPEHWDAFGAKNFKIEGTSASLGGRQLYISNYVHVEVALSDPNNSSTSDDILIEGAKRGYVSTGAGHDKIEIGNSTNTDTNPGFSDRFGIDAGSGNDTVIFRPANDEGVVDSPYVNYEDGHSTSTLVDLGSGNDSFDSTGGADTTGGGASAFDSMDTVDGGSGNDTIMSGDGADSLNGGSGSDILDAGEGKDTITGDSGNDSIDAGAGADWVSGDSGNDTINGGGGADWLSGDGASTNSGNDIVNGGGGDDTIEGGSGSDLLNGDGGEDWLVGGSGTDTINGGNGADTLHGGTGNDLLTGGNGADTFVFLNETIGKDIVLDFVSGEDKIDLAAYGITQAQIDTNNDGFVNASDSLAKVVSGDLQIKFNASNTIVLDNVTSIDVTDFVFA